jgi:hypothetical protein
MKDLKITRIGKLVNKLAKMTSGGDLRARALEVVAKWKKELSRLKEEEDLQARQDSHHKRGDRSPTKEGSQLHKRSYREVRSDASPTGASVRHRKRDEKGLDDGLNQPGPASFRGIMTNNSGVQQSVIRRKRVGFKNDASMV